MSQDMKRPSVYQYILTFAILMLFWYILSGYLEFFYIGAGIVCCGIVTLISGDLVFRSDVRIARSAHVFIRFSSTSPDCWQPSSMPT